MRKKITNIYLRDPSKNKRLKKPVIVVQYRSGRQKGRTLNCDIETARKIVQQMKNELELGVFTVDKYFEKKKIRSLNLADFYEEYLNYRQGLVNRMQLSEKTLLQDQDSLRLFIRFLGSDFKTLEIGKEAIDNFVDHLLATPSTRGEARSFNSINTYLRHLSSAFTWGVEKGFLEENPLKGYRKLPSQSSGPKYLTPIEEQRLRTYFQGRPIWQRDVFELSLACGLRAGEFLNLQKENLHTEIINGEVEHFLWVLGKGRKKRLVPLNEISQEILFRRTEWIDHPEKIREVLSEINPSPHYLKKHLERARQGFLFFEISRRDSITGAFRKAALATGIKGKNIHACRHTFGTRAADAGIPLEVIQEIMGHEDPRTTRIYSKVTLKNMAQNIRKLTKYSEEYRKQFSE